MRLRCRCFCSFIAGGADLLFVVMMLARFATTRSASSFLLTTTTTTTSTTSSRWSATTKQRRELSSGRRPSIDFDGLMDDVVNRRVSLSAPPVPAAADGGTSADGVGWRSMDWNDSSAMIRDNDNNPTTTSSFHLPPSPVEVMTIGDRIVYMKRDDQLRLPGSQISGNKVCSKNQNLRAERLWSPQH